MRVLLACLLGMLSALAPPPLAGGDPLPAAGEQAAAAVVEEGAASAPPAPPAPAFLAPTSFAPGERLDFVVEWAGVGAADSTMEISRETLPDGREAYRILSLTTSRTFVDLLYKVRNRFESWMDPTTISTLKYVVEQKEGGRKRNFTLLYDQERGEVTRLSKDKEGRSKSELFTTERGVLDSLGALYALRERPMKVGDQFSLAVFEGKKTYQLAVEVEKAEEVEVPAGRFKTLKLHPRLGEDGIFRKQGDLWVWVTDDARHMPVQMRSKVKVGSITAVLDRFVEGGAAPAGDPP